SHGVLPYGALLGNFQFSPSLERLKQSICSLVFCLHSGCLHSFKGLCQFRKWSLFRGRFRKDPYSQSLPNQMYVSHFQTCPRFLFFLVLGIGYMFSPNMKYVAPIQERVVFGMFFLGAILCLCFSWLFHTVYCHSEKVSRTFSKLDYSGIALLTMGSFVPWLYYSFYCSPQPQLIYLIIICVLGITAIMVSQWDHFATPQYRAVRAGVFLGLGLSGLVPTLHFMITEGFIKATTVGQIGWLFLMAVLYILGVGLYAARIPERFFPGKCDIWFHSHQIFHVLVVAAACVHLHGVSQLQAFRSSLGGSCTENTVL
uniref:Adiponectin receptor 2 n=1 Tax=Naja naja TaxID=35670 RepID=A0A8C6X716_NAJNA